VNQERSLGAASLTFFTWKASGVNGGEILVREGKTAAF